MPEWFRAAHGSAGPPPSTDLQREAADIRIKQQVDDAPRCRRIQNQHRDGDARIGLHAAVAVCHALKFVAHDNGTVAPGNARLRLGGWGGVGWVEIKGGQGSEVQHACALSGAAIACGTMAVMEQL